MTLLKARALFRPISSPGSEQTKGFYDLTVMAQDGRMQAKIRTLNGFDLIAREMNMFGMWRSMG
jgi:hypothetical protein